MIHMKRVVVTGLGLVSPLGCGVKPTWERLIDAQSGIRKIAEFDTSDLAAKIAGRVPRGNEAPGAYDPNDWMEPKEQRKVDEFIIYAIAAATQAIEDSGWKPEREEDRERTGVLIGSGIGGLQVIADGAITLRDRGARRISPFFIPAALINLASGHVSIR